MAIILDGSNATTGGLINAGTAVATTSGTSITFTGIPSTAKRITVMFNGVGTSGNSVPQIQVGSGSATTSGYVSKTFNIQGTTPSTYSITSGFGLIVSGNYSSSTPLVGHLIITNISGNIWIASGTIARTDNGSITIGSIAGNISLSGALDRVILTTVNGTDTFGAGTANIFWE